MKKIQPILILLSVLFTNTVTAQICSPSIFDPCNNISITGLPATLCVSPAGTVPPVTPIINFPAPLEFTGYTWTPLVTSWPMSISSTDVGLTTIFPSAPLPATYCLDATALGPELIVNGDFNSGNMCFISAYGFDPILVFDAPIGAPTFHNFQEGSYNIFTNMLSYGPTACSFGDHTTGTGNMMIVNGESTIPNVPVWTQTVNVCPGARYQFSFWSANWSAATPGLFPQIQVFINGGAAIGTANITTACGIWQQYMFAWVAPPGIAVANIRLVDGNMGFLFNDFVLDDISMRRISTAQACITLNPTPANPIASYTGCSVPCPGTPLTFLVTGTPGSIANWEWTDPLGGIHSEPGFTIGGAGTTILIPGSGLYPPGTFTIDILNVTLNGCVGGGFMTTVTTDWPKADFVLHSYTTCPADPVTLAFTGPAGGVVYFNTVPTSGPDIAVPIGASGTGTYLLSPGPLVTTTYQITGATGCCTYMFSGSTITVTVLPVPSVTLTNSNPCEGAPLVLTATATPPSTTYIYGWTLPSLTTYATTVPSYLVTSSATSGHSGVYSVTVWNGACSVTATTSVSVTTMPTITATDGWAGPFCVPYYSSSVYPVTIDFMATAASITPYWGCGLFPGTKLIAGPLTIIFPCDITPATWVPTSCWSPGPTTVPYPTCPMLPVTARINYIVATSVSHLGCKWSISVPIDPGCVGVPPPSPRPEGGSNKTSIAENSTRISILPNPNTGSFTLSGQLPCTDACTVEIEVTDILGKTIYSEKTTVDKGKLNTRINLGADIANGIYLVRVKNNDMSEVIRFTLDR